MAIRMGLSWIYEKVLKSERRREVEELGDLGMNNWDEIARLIYVWGRTILENAV
jgi:hypothetical protein